MKNIYVDSTESLWLSEQFKGKFVSVDEIISTCEDLMIEVKELKDELAELKQDLQDNYKPIDPDYD